VKELFVDTSAFVALAAPRDRNHKAAIGLMVVLDAVL